MPEMKDPFSGAWDLDTRNSVFDPRHSPSDGTLQFDCDGEDYIMRIEGVRDGKTVVEPALRFQFDGNGHPIPGAPGLIAVSSRVDANTIKVNVLNEGITVGEGTYQVSPDGLTLTTALWGFDGEQNRYESRVTWNRSATAGG